MRPAEVFAGEYSGTRSMLANRALELVDQSEFGESSAINGCDSTPKSMNALIIADDDSALNGLPESQVEVLISCGDLLDTSIIRTAARCQCKQILAVKGKP